MDVKQMDKDQSAETKGLNSMDSVLIPYMPGGIFMGHSLGERKYVSKNRLRSITRYCPHTNDQRLDLIALLPC